MQLITSSELLVVFAASLLIVPLIGGAILRLIFKLMGVPGTTFRRCWMAYLAAWLTASALCTGLFILLFNVANPTSLHFDLVATVGIGTHLVVVPLVMRVGWGKAAIAQVLTIVTYTLLLLPVAIPLVMHIQAKSERVLAQNNVRLICDAMMNYADVMQVLPSDAIYSKDGQPLLSWRVAILPYLEQQPLYERFKLDEPWDSPHNKPLIAEMPEVFKMPGVESQAGMTHFQVFAQTWSNDEHENNSVVGRAPFGRAYPNGPPAKLNFLQTVMQDGSSNTVLMVEADQAVPWTKPADLPFGPDIPLPKLGAAGDGMFVAVFFDSHVQFLPTDIDPNVLRAIVTYDGGEIVSLP